MPSAVAPLIDTVVREGLAPYLNAAGFRKRSRNFHRFVGEVVQVVNVQASPWNTDHEGEFTLNLGVYFPALAEVLNLPIPPKLPTEADCHARERIGILLPVRRDYWWRIAPDSDLDRLGIELRDAWLLYGAPWIERNLDLREVREGELRQKAPFRAAAVSIVLGERERAAKELQQAIDGFPERAEHFESWGRKHGLF